MSPFRTTEGKNKTGSIMGVDFGNAAGGSFQIKKTSYG